MSALESILESAPSARLIPVIPDSRKEEKIVSIFLATLSVVRPFAERILGRCSIKVGKTADLCAYTEVDFASADGNGVQRPDGVLTLSTRGKKSTWTALVEAKIGNSDINEEQIHRYGKIAIQHKVDAVITLSNRLVSLPTHLPYSIPDRIANRVNFFHVSWISILTEAALILRDTEVIAAEQEFILREMVRYFESSKSGVARFDRMSAEWKHLITEIRMEQQFRYDSPEIENTVASWRQEERDICLILSRRIGKNVTVRLTRKYRDDASLRHRDACKSLIDTKVLRSAFRIPNAANDLEVMTDLQKRTISCSMKLDAPKDKKTARARIAWLSRQLRDVDAEGVIVRAFWLGRGLTTQATLAELKNDVDCLNDTRNASAPTSFEVARIKALAGRFSGQKTFIEDLENLIPDFYDRIGQRLKPWIPKPPPIEKRDPIQDGDKQELNRTQEEDRTGGLPMDRDESAGLSDDADPTP